MPFGRPFRAISLCVSFPGLKPWGIFCSPVGRLELAQENVQTLVSLRDQSHSPIEAPHNYLSAYGAYSWVLYAIRKSIAYGTNVNRLEGLSYFTLSLRRGGSAAMV